jgi:7,8-dihydro-6-hydroxymethylpterin-pyrophosphokinase
MNNNNSDNNNNNSFPQIAERAQKLNEMEKLLDENKTIIRRSNPNDVDARERARANYDKAVEIHSEIEDLSVSEVYDQISRDSTYQERGVNIVIEMDNNLKDRRWANTE